MMSHDPLCPIYVCGGCPYHPKWNCLCAIIFAVREDEQNKRKIMDEG